MTKNIEDAVAYLNLLAKLWEGLEGQKQWFQTRPAVLPILDDAIEGVRHEIIKVAKKESRRLKPKRKN